MPRRIALWAVWWVASWWGFLLLAGDWNRIEWVGAAGVATLTATTVELVRAAAGVDGRLSAAPLRGLPAALAQIFVDFGLLVVALVQRRRGLYRARPTDAADAATTVVVAGLSPNAYVVDLDPEQGTVLLHDLVPHERSERPA